MEKRLKEIYNSFFNYFQSNRLFTPSQFSLLPVDSCIAKLLSVIDKIQDASDENPTVDVFLDISKAFDKVWYDGIILKLKAYVLEGELVSLLKNYFENRELFWMVKLWVEKNNAWSSTRILGPLLFLIYINELPDGINSLCKIFACDASLFSMIYDISKSVSELNAEVEKIRYLAYQWKMQFNPDPNKHANEIIFSGKPSSNNLLYPW